MLTRLLLLSVAVAGAASTQSPAVGAPLGVYLDCQLCDFDFFRTEITSVNWVRDRQVADVDILVTGQETGAGGTEFTLAFLGSRRLAGRGDTLQYVSPPNAPRDDVRRGLAHVIEIGLAPLVARVSGYDRVTVSFVAPDSSAAPPKPSRDKWNAWVFRISLNSFANGEATSSFRNVRGQLSANRVTERWKSHISVDDSYDQSSFTLSDSTKFVDIKRGSGVHLREVKSLTPRWSAGLRASLNSSTYLNERRLISATPAVEFDVFPYADATRRQITVEYRAGVASYVYNDTTIYRKTRETRPLHALVVGVGARQPWGSVNVSAQAHAFLDDASKRSETLFGNIQLQLVKGLSLDLFGNISSLRDQIYLAKGSISDADILVRQRQLATNYQYFYAVGLSYTFGSIFNNVVNPRLDGVGGGGGRFFSCCG